MICQSTLHDLTVVMSLTLRFTFGKRQSCIKDKEQRVPDYSSMNLEKWSGIILSLLTSYKLEKVNKRI